MVASGGGNLRLGGEIGLRNARAIREELLDALGSVEGELAVDISDVTYLDGAGTAVLLELDRAARSAGKSVRLEGRCEAAEGMLGLVEWESLATMAPPAGRACQSLPVQIGENALHLLHEARRMFTFTGALALCGLRALVRPWRFPWRRTFSFVDVAGVDAVPIVVLISTLMGMIMAFLGAIQLKPYGAGIYVADMVALAMVRELGPIMTSILVAGRSGSGFAAEIGAMVVDDEVDALVTMGFDPVAHLAVPRVAAVVLAMPALAMFSNLAGVLGGLAVGVGQLDLTLTQYLNETKAILSVRHFSIGLVKSLFFGLMAGSVGCYKGLGVSREAEGVGRAATSAVVTGIFLIILADALFAVVLTYLPF